MQSLHKFNWSVRDMEFLWWDQFQLDQNLLNHDSLKALGINRELFTALLHQAQQFAVKELDPIDSLSDEEGCSLNVDGNVVLPSLFPSAWEKFKQAGWNELAKSFQDKISLPKIASQGLLELMFGACPSFMMYGGFGMPMAHVINTFGNNWLKTTFINNLVDLKWAGCFCVTEPQAGSDVGNIRTKATLQNTGMYLIEGEKIFITAGMHDLVENIVYLVVARTSDAPKGTLGLSCFLVPRFIIENGKNTRLSNGVVATRIEKKMGLSGCATTALSFGFNQPCHGYLIGDQENKGLNQIASLMALARMSTGLIALGIASKAYQNAAAYAQQRQQGTNVRQVLNPKAPKIAIAQHADVKRMLLEMKAKVEGCRALITKLSFHYTHIQYHEEGVFELSAEALSNNERWVSLLIPLVKAYISDQSWRVSELAIQVFGGHGYIRDNPVERSARDCKILSIWEGTNFLQSAELVREACAMGRKAPSLDQATEAITAFLETERVRSQFPDEATKLESALKSLISAHQAIGGYTKLREIDHVFFSSTRFLSVLAETIIAWLLLEGAVIAQRYLEENPDELNEVNFMQGRIWSMNYFVLNLLPITIAQANIICEVKPMIAEVNPGIFT